MLLANHLHERQPRIDARGHDIGTDLLSIRKRNTDRAAVLQQNVFNRRFGANLDACFACCIADRIRDRARTATRESPRAKRAIDLVRNVLRIVPDAPASSLLKKLEMELRATKPPPASRRRP